MEKLKAYWRLVLHYLALFFHRKRLIRYAIYACVLLLLFLCRFAIMRQMARHLMVEDPLQKSIYCFVLGGNSLDRGLEAVKLYKEGWVQTIVCTGANVPSVLKAINESMTEAEITAQCIRDHCSIPDNQLIVINASTSTEEELELIARYCNDQHIDTALIISSAFHMRRVANVARRKFQHSTTKVILHGAPSSQFNELEWWKKEEGMIAINNEYLKLMYYFIKY